MKQMMILVLMSALAFSIACSGDEAENAAESAKESASEMMEDMGHSADAAMGDAKSAAAKVATDAVSACRSLAESGSWDQALEVCKKAHEMLPDDMALEHAYQQAQAAAN